MHIATRYFSIHTSLISESILLDLRIAQVLGLHTYLARFTSTFDFCIVPQNFRQKTLQLGKKPKKKSLHCRRLPVPCVGFGKCAHMEGKRKCLKSRALWKLYKLLLRTSDMLKTDLIMIKDIQELIC